MRLIGSFDTEKQAYGFYSFLLKEGIQNIYEVSQEQKTDAKQYRIWVYDEDDLERACQWMQAYREHPEDPKFLQPDTSATAAPPSPDYREISESEDLKWQSVPSKILKVHRFSATFTHAIIILCAFVFFWNSAQEAHIDKDKGELAVEIGLTPLEQQLFFDDPSAYRYIQEMIDTVDLKGVKDLKNLPPAGVDLLKKAEDTPSYRGLYALFLMAKTQGWQAARATPMFEKIQQGQLFRLFTPCLMHANLLHILFNMVWVWILLRQIEQRLPRWKICLLILLMGIVSNVAQYLVSGPLFLGFSGVIVGLAGFIWSRQAKAPWEGYPLQKSTLLFLLFFVLAMFVIELFTFSLHLLTQIQLTPDIANTAHLVGGAYGHLSGKIIFFQKEGQVTLRDLVILGCSSQQPTRNRNHGAYLVRWNEQGLLFDPGEGTQRQFIFANVAPTCVTHIFVSHFHGDHCLGLGSMLMRLNLDKVLHPIHCYYPASGQTYFDRLRHGTIYHQTIQIVEHPIAREGIVERRWAFYHRG